MRMKRYQVEQLYDDELQHFGIKGMKWKHKKSPGQLLADAKRRAAAYAKNAGKTISKAKSKLKSVLGSHVSEHTRYINGKKVSRTVTTKDGNGKVTKRDKYDYGERKKRRGGPYKINNEKRINDQGKKNIAKLANNLHKANDRRKVPGVSYPKKNTLSPYGKKLANNLQKANDRRKAPGVSYPKTGARQKKIENQLFGETMERVGASKAAKNWNKSMNRHKQPGVSYPGKTTLSPALQKQVKKWKNNYKTNTRKR